VRARLAGAEQDRHGGQAAEQAWVTEQMDHEALHVDVTATGGFYPVTRRCSAIAFLMLRRAAAVGEAASVSGGTDP
jgi:hypothetical protein